MDNKRLKHLSGMHPQYQQLKELKADRQKMIDTFDRIIREVDQGNQLDEGIFSGLRAALATVGQLGAAGAKATAEKVKAVSDKVKQVYQDEKAKVELNALIANMKKIGTDLEKMGKDSNTIVEKDDEVKQAMMNFDANFKATLKVLQTRLELTKQPKE